MYFMHAPEIWTDFPTLAAGVLVIDGIHPKVDVVLEIQELYKRAQEKLGEGTETEFPEIKAWRNTYSTMGLKPTQYRCAAESLLRRFRKEQDLPRFHPLVDLCNALSIAYAIPIAVYDTDHVEDYIEVRFAKGTETYHDFNGEIDNPVEKEVIFADGRGEAHSRRWCFRQNKNSTVRPETARVLIVTEAHHENAKENIQSLIDELAELIEGKWNPPKIKVILSQDNPKLEFDY